MSMLHRFVLSAAFGLWLLKDALSWLTFEIITLSCTNSPISSFEKHSNNTKYLFVTPNRLYR
jgi:hypothetical protein